MPPVFAHGAMRLYLLALLAEGPKHGYEIIKALGDRFGGSYTPSAGTVYPRLGKLQEEGLVETAQDGRRTIYTLTAAGSEELESRREELATIELDIASSVRKLADDMRTDIRDTMKSLRADLAAAAQSARSGAGRPDPSPSGPSAGHRQPMAGRDEGYRHLKDAEAALSEFRNRVRAELRRHNASAPLDGLTTETLRTVLDQARISIESTLKP